MTPAEQELAADLARLDHLTPEQLLLETGLAELLAAEGRETAEDLAYRAALEKRAHRITKEDVCGRVGCECCPTSAYCQASATTGATAAGWAAVRYPGLSPATGRVCGQCAADLQDLQARIDRQA